MKSNKAIQNEYSFVKKEGEILVAESVIADRSGWAKAGPLYDNVGNVIGAIESIREITERKRAEEALRESEQKFRSLFESSRDAIMTLSPPSWCFTTGNQATIEMFETVSEEAFTALGPWELSPEFQPDGRPSSEKAAEMIQMALANGSHFFEWTHRRLGGESFPATVLLTRMEIGGQTLLQSTVRNITAEKQVEAAFAESRRQLANIIEFLPDATLVIDKEGKVIAWNLEMEKLTGIAASDMLGKGDYEYSIPIYGDRRPVLIDRILDPHKEDDEKYVGPGDPDSAILTEVHAKALGDVYLSATASTLRNSKGNIVGAIESMRDVTQRRKAEEEKSQLKAQLLQAQKMEAFGVLAGGIAHDFNNILGIIVGYSELVKFDLPEHFREKNNIEQVLKACSRAKDLIRQILTFSRPDDGQPRCPVDIRPTVKESLKFLRASLPATIEIRQTILSETASILAHSTQIHQVLTNLCMNAMHAMEEMGGILEVSLTDVELRPHNMPLHSDLQLGPHIRLTVSDTGKGIDEATLPRIFDPYFTTKEFGKGTGLGLATVQGIVKNHQGAVIVSSKEGEGTTFDVYFPKIKAGQTTPEESKLPIPHGTERILFVDDEKSLLDIWCKSLGRLGYKITIAENGLEALDFFRAVPWDFDLVITDFTMPHMTGIDLAREIMLIRPDIPVALCSGTRKMTEAQKQQAGIRAFLAKPLELREVACTIRKVLNKGLK